MLTITIGGYGNMIYIVWSLLLLVLGSPVASPARSPGARQACAAEDAGVRRESGALYRPPHSGDKESYC